MCGFELEPKQITNKIAFFWHTATARCSVFRIFILVPIMCGSRNITVKFFKILHETDVDGWKYAAIIYVTLYIKRLSNIVILAYMLLMFDVSGEPWDHKMK